MNAVKKALLFPLLAALFSPWSFGADGIRPADDDLPEMKKRGTLRVLMTTPPDCGGLPRQMSPRDYELSLVTEAASEMGLETVVVYVDKFEDVFPALLEGKGDIVADNIVANNERRKQIAFTIPVKTSTDQIIAKADNTGVKSAKDLKGKTVHIEKETDYWRKMRVLADNIGGINLVAADDCVDTEELMHMVGTGQIEFAAADSNYTGSFLMFRSDIKIIHNFNERCSIVWAVRPESQELLASLNRYLKKELPGNRFLAMKGDLPVIKKRGVLRVLTRNNFTSYFVHRGELVGYHYELAREFAKRNGLRLLMIVPPKWGDMIPWLLDGKGDVIATRMSLTDERLKIAGAAFCESFDGYRQVLVARNDGKAPRSYEDLNGRTIAARRSSSYWEAGAKLRDSGISVNLRAVPEELETHQVIAKVASGEYDITIADDDILNVELSKRNDIVGAFPLTEELKSSWMVRAEDNKLREAISEFFVKERRGAFRNVVFNKYFKSRMKILELHTQYVKRQDGFFFSDYDNLIRKHAERYGLPWCLIAAQIYQESRFDPTAVSWSGARGLMQVMPATAAELGFGNVQEPSTNINAGTKYLRSLIGKFEDGVQEDDKYCFALASYNGGYGHVIDARCLARELQLDPNRWERNVEKTMEMLEQHQYHVKTKYGFCRGDEIADYVRSIFLRYKAYQQEVSMGK